MVVLSEEVLTSVKQAIAELEKNSETLAKTIEDMQKEKSAIDEDLFALNHLVSRYEHEKILEQNVSFALDNTSKW